MMEFGHGVILCGIVLLTILLLLTLFIFIWYSGLLENISVGAGPPPYGQLTVMYKFGRGPYKDVGAIFTEVTSIAPKNKCFGIYYDDPNQVAPEKLRWIVGSIVAEGDEKVDDDLMAALQKEQYKRYVLPDVNNAVTTKFPYRSQLSVLVGMYRVYPLLGDYIRTLKLCAHPFIEIYTSDLIHYYAPLSKQDCFYVPECFPEYLAEETTINKTFVPSVSKIKDIDSGAVHSAKGNTKPRVAKPDASTDEVPNAGKKSISIEKSQDIKEVHSDSCGTGQVSGANAEGSDTGSKPAESSGTSLPSGCISDAPECNKYLADVGSPAASPEVKIQQTRASFVYERKHDQVSAGGSNIGKKVTITGSDGSTKEKADLQHSGITSTALISDDESASDVESSRVNSLSGGDRSSVSSYSPSGTSGSSSQAFSGSTSSGASGELSQDVSASSNGHFQEVDAKGVLVELSSDSEGEAEPAAVNTKPAAEV